MNYTNRHHEIRTVESVDHGVSYGSSGHGMFPEMEGKVKPGDEVVVETTNGFTVSGVRDLATGQWYFHKSDEDLESDRKAFSLDLKKKRQESLDAHREEWQQRTNALPEWIKVRIDKFQESPAFATEGWGYELCVAELAVLYFESEGEESDAISEYSREHGTSGNQHECARALANMHGEGENLYGTISALSPLTGDAYYEDES